MAPIYGFCHGDLQTRNVHIVEPDRLTVFDFDCCGYSWRAYEFASILREFGGDGPASECFHSSLSEIRQLSKAEADVIPYFWAVRSIWELGLQTATFVDDLGYNRVMALLDLERAKLRNWIAAQGWI